MALAERGVCFQSLASRACVAVLVMLGSMCELRIVAFNCHALRKRRGPRSIWTFATLAVLRWICTSWAQLTLTAILVKVPPLRANANCSVHLRRVWTSHTTVQHFVPIHTFFTRYKALVRGFVKSEARFTRARIFRLAQSIVGAK